MDSEAKQRCLSVERIIAAPAGHIFDVLADPHLHIAIDGSGSLLSVDTADCRLTLGSTFSVRVRRGISYRTKNRVIACEKNRLIAWAHWRRTVWRYELEPLDGSRTLVRESFDWSGARWPRAIEIVRDHHKSLPAMEATLEKLAEFVESGREKPLST